MAGKASASFTMLLFFLAVASPLHAQKMGEYSFELLPDGSPRFTQVLRWEGDPNVLYYEFTLQRDTGEEISVWKLQEPTIQLNLDPGDYRYRIVLYNLLGKPELELPWRNVTVRKAEIPRITDVSPKAWFLEDLKPVVTLSGENLSPEAKIELRAAQEVRDGAASGPSIIGKELERNGTTTVRVAFPITDMTAGEYTLVITNPGGLSFTVPGAISIRYQRPMELLFSVGYAPWISLYDSWYTDAWPGSFFPMSAMSRLSTYFIKRPYGYFGAELTVAGRLMEGGIDAAVIDSQVGLIGVNGIYKHPFSTAIAVALRLGSGVAMSHHAFDYDGTSGAELYSLDPYVSAGFSFQYFLTKRIFLEAGTDWVHVFTRGFAEGGLMPSLSAGFLF